MNIHLCLPSTRGHATKSKINTQCGNIFTPVYSFYSLFSCFASSFSLYFFFLFFFLGPSPFRMEENFLRYLLWHRIRVYLFLAPPTPTLARAPLPFLVWRQEHGLGACLLQVVWLSFDLTCSKEVYAKNLANVDFLLVLLCNGVAYLFFWYFSFNLKNKGINLANWDLVKQRDYGVRICSYVVWALSETKTYWKNQHITSYRFSYYARKRW